jgi:hypothetical protein
LDGAKSAAVRLPRLILDEAHHRHVTHANVVVGVAATGVITAVLAPMACNRRCSESVSTGLLPLHPGILMLLITNQHEISADTVLGDKTLQQCCGELNFLTIVTFDQHLPHYAPIIVQVLVSR